MCHRGSKFNKLIIFTAWSRILLSNTGFLILFCELGFRLRTVRSLGHGDQQSQCCRPRENLGVWCYTTSLQKRLFAFVLFRRRTWQFNSRWHSHLVSPVETYCRFLYTDIEVSDAVVFTEESLILLPVRDILNEFVTQYILRWSQVDKS